MKQNRDFQSDTINVMSIKLADVVIYMAKVKNLHDKAKAKSQYNKIVTKDSLTSLAVIPSITRVHFP